MDAFYQITDDGFPGAKSLDFIGQRIVYVEPFGRYWGWSDLVDASSWNSLEQAQAETSPDRIQGLIVSHNEVLIFGERTIEPWAHTPTDTAVFQLQVGSVIESGCAAGRTIQRLDNAVFYLTNNGQIARLNGYTPQVVSTAAMEASIRDLNWSRAFAFTWEDAGHVVYYITFPDGPTWGFDVRQNKWHRRESYGIDRWRINALAKSNGKYIAGDYSSGRVYEVQWGNVYEACEIMPRKIRTGVLHNGSNRVRVDGFRLVAATGQPPTLPVTVDETAGFPESRWLGSGQIAAGSRASARGLSFAGEWVEPADSEVVALNSTSTPSAQRYGDYMFEAVEGHTNLRVASITDLETWSDGPANPSSTSGMKLVPSGDRLFCFTVNGASAYYLDSPDDTSWTTAGALPDGYSTERFYGMAGNGTQALAVNANGQLYSSSDNGATWALGAAFFLPNRRFTASGNGLGPMDVNGDRFVIGFWSDVQGAGACYTDDTGATVTDCVFPSGVRDVMPMQVKHCGDGNWLIAFQTIATPLDDGLYLSTDNGVTFNPVDLPVPMYFDPSHSFSIGVDGYSGRVLIAGFEVGTTTRRWYYTDDFVTWTAVDLTDSVSNKISEIYPVGSVDIPYVDTCTPMDGGLFQLRYANDGAENYSNYRDAEAPRTGWFLQPLIWRRLGMARHRVWEIMDTSNRPQDVIAAEIIAQ